MLSWHGFHIKKPYISNILQGNHEEYDFQILLVRERSPGK